MQFAETVKSQLALRGWSIRKFADEIGRSPEHARKISTGLAFPSDDLALRIAEKLEIDPEDFQGQVASDRFQKRYGKKPPQRARTDLEPIEGLWDQLTPEQRDCVVCVANCLTMRNRRRAQ